ncbi:MAG: DUF3472 domain-containing protein [Ruminococcaceae bacterium]|nr:DUF3472 domain-containing protein [Oscillospiraceae bacterium]
MKNNILKAAVCMVLSLAFVLSAAITSFADGTHGFFMTCYTDVTDDKTDGFMMDFYSDSENALCTYWSNANWSMYTGASVKKLGYLSITGGGAYAGLQILDRPEQRRGIMSMWRYEYTDIKTRERKYLYAKAIYGKTTSFSNEGSGTSCVMEYDWKSNQWYREMILCWEDAETGYTFIGNWYYDYEADQWSLFAYYNTFLVESYMKGDIGQFLENFVESTRENYRSFRYRNIYMLPYQGQGIDDWKSCDKIYITSDANPKAHGEAQLGLSDDKTYVWAWVDGKSSVDTDEKIDLTAKLVQPDKPTVGTPSIGEFTVKDSVNKDGEIKHTKVEWSMADHSTPQLSYNVVFTDIDGKVLASASGTRPEVETVTVDSFGTDAYKCTITVKDVFGQTATSEYESATYGKADTTAPDGTVTPDKTDDIAPETKAPETSTTPVETGSENGEEKSNMGTVVAIVAAAVVAIGVVAFVLITIKNRKKK